MLEDPSISEIRTRPSHLYLTDSYLPDDQEKIASTAARQFVVSRDKCHSILEHRWKAYLSNSGIPRPLRKLRRLPLPVRHCQHDDPNSGLLM